MEWGALWKCRVDASGSFFPPHQSPTAIRHSIRGPSAPAGLELALSSLGASGNTGSGELRGGMPDFSLTKYFSAEARTWYGDSEVTEWAVADGQPDSLRTTPRLGGQLSLSVRHDVFPGSCARPQSLGDYVASVMLVRRSHGPLLTGVQHQVWKRLLPYSCQ